MTEESERLVEIRRQLLHQCTEEWWQTIYQRFPQPVSMSRKLNGTNFYGSR
jgi:hypothetical protein